MSTLFVLLDYCIIILISALYNPSHCLFVRTKRGEVYALFGCIDSFKTVHYVVAILHLKALEQFTFSGFLLMLYMQKTSCVCLVILLLYLLCICIHSVLQDLSSTGAMMKNNQSDVYGSRAYTLLKFLTSQIHDLCKVSCI